MKNLLIITGHTHNEYSIANKEIESLLRAKYPHARVVNLSKEYPDYRIDVKIEQENLLWADTIIIQTPMFWYSMTSIVMRYIEEVFDHGFAYGSEGDKLKGKKIIVSFTGGAAEEDYRLDGEQGITLKEIMRPIEITFHFCSLDYKGYLFTGGILNTGDMSEEEKKEIHEKSVSHVEKLVAMVEKE